MHLDVRSVLLGSVLLAAVSAQDPTGKPMPVGSPVMPDTKIGPAEPWIAPPLAAPADVSRIASDKPADPEPRPGFDLFAAGSGVLFDTTESGTVVAAARSYKMLFDHGRASFVPFLGSRARTEHAVEFSLAGVQVGGLSLELKARPDAVRIGDVVEFDHGALRVRHELRRAEVEQTFRFDSLPVRDTIRIDLAVQTDLSVDDSPHALLFRSSDGGMDYGTATAIDATGRELRLAREWHDGRLSLIVPASFVADAKLPLVVDPLLTAASSVTGIMSTTLRESDVVFDEATQSYMVAVELVYSATDSDVYTYEMDADGQPIPGSVSAVDSTTVSWQNPRIANNVLAHRNLVVAQVSTGNVSPFVIRGRTRVPGTTSVGPQTTIEDQSNATGDKIHPDVGGDPHLAAPTYFTVVWERVYTSSDHDIHAVQVTNADTPTRVSPSTILIDNSAQYEQDPQISNSAGAPMPDATYQHFMVVWKRATATGSEIRARTIRWEGLLGTNFVVSAGDVLQDLPSVSTVTVPGEYSGHLYLVAWEQGYLTDSGDTNDIMVRLCDQSGAVVSPTYNLQILESAGSAIDWNQFRPRVASDGCRFVVAYGENYQNLGDLDVRVTTLHAIPAGAGQYTLARSEGRVAPAYTSNVETMHALCADFESSGAVSGGPVARSIRYGIAWHDAGSGSGNEIRFRLYAGMSNTGGFVVVPTACGSATISYGGTPALTESMSIATNGQAILVGTRRASPLLLCSTCLLAVDAFTTLGPSQTLMVPCNVGLIGGTLGFQGVKVWVGEPCVGNLVSLSDTVLVTFR